jgi:hypothetical protein
VLEGDLTKEHRTRNLAIDFVFTGWRCEACGETFATDEVNDQISRVADARLVALGLRPAVDLEAVAAIKQAEQTRSRTSTRG